MSDERGKAEFDLQSLTRFAPFLLVVDENQTVTWASEAVLRRLESTVGRRIGDLLECRETQKDPCKRSSGGVDAGSCKVALTHGGSHTNLVGRWVRSGADLVLFGLPDLTSIGDLGQFCLDDLPQESHLLDFLGSRDEAERSLKDAGRAAAELKRKNSELEESKKRMEDEASEREKQRLAMLNMLEDIEGAKSELEAINNDLEHEITQRRLAERKLRRASVALDAMIDGVTITDMQGHIIDVNEGAIKQTGYAREEVVGRTPGELFIAECDGPKFQEIIKNLMKGRDIRNIDFVSRRKDGTEFPASVNLSVIRDSTGAPKEVVAVHRDVTEARIAEEKLKQTMEKLERSNQDLAQFAFVASHDLMEPLRMVSSYTQLLAKRYKDKLDSDANEFIDFAVDGANRMQSLITDLLEFSRVDTRGKVLEPTDSEAVLREALANLREAINESGAVVTNGPLPSVMADHTQLMRLFQNLVGNAIKFRGEKKPRIHVSSELLEAKSVFSVKDNGIGIDPQYSDRIFQIFQRLHARDEYPGTGIGLAVCKRIVERHGGKISVESELGRGSTFRFSLGLSDIEQSPDSTLEAAA